MGKRAALGTAVPALDLTMALTAALVNHRIQPASRQAALTELRRLQKKKKKGVGEDINIERECVHI